ncbi:MAG: fumarylacetoacetate hydrolase [Nocardioides sp.]|nr:fumarylacetoacetate hydrolase [Nocardioides sp.]
MLRPGREPRAFQVGSNGPRCPAARTSAAGRLVAGAFVDGGLLVRAVTECDPDDHLHGNFLTAPSTPPADRARRTDKEWTQTMKLLRVGPAGSEVAACLRPDGTLVDISDLVPDITSDLIASGLPALRSAIGEATDLPVLDGGAVRTGAPIADPGKVVCVGLNYREHAAEAGLSVPDEPILFMKAPYTVNGPHDDVPIPPGSVKTDYEVELAVVIGREARYLAESDDPLRHVAGYTISNDVSERAFQLERGGQWDKGKNCEGFNPLGPWFVTADEVPDPQALGLELRVNGQIRQRSNTSDMIFSIRHLVWYVSQFMALQPGDVINTGTPAGVGSGFDPARFLEAGDVVELTIEGLGAQRHTFVPAQVRR